MRCTAYLSSLGFTGGVGGARGVRVLFHILGSGKAFICCNVASFLFFFWHMWEGSRWMCRFSADNIRNSYHS